MKYRSKFEDDWGNVEVKELNRPKICHYLYEFLPLIDEHNKQRQSILSIERKWATKNCWFRLLTSVLGFSVVDMHRWYRNLKEADESRAIIQRRRSSLRDYALFELEKDNEIQIKKFSDILCANLEDNLREQNS